MSKQTEKNVGGILTLVAHAMYLKNYPKDEINSATHKKYPPKTAANNTTKLTKAYTKATSQTRDEDCVY
jgi:hypothetical protein